MDVLWAPWRIAYITRAGLGQDDCCFCLPPEYQGPHRQRLVLYSDPVVLVMMNLYPYNNGHLLIAPRRHVATMALAESHERAAIMDQAARATDILTQVMKPQGFNLGINQGRVSGGSVEKHLHLHVTPRYQGDSNYMTVFGQTRVISEAIEEAYDKLVELFNES